MYPSVVARAVCPRWMGLKVPPYMARRILLLLGQDDAGLFGVGLIQHQLGANALDGLGIHFFTQLLAGFPGGEGAALLHGALDQLPGFQGIPGGLAGVFGDAILADIEDGGQGIAHGAQERALLAVEFRHGIISFINKLV